MGGTGAEGEEAKVSVSRDDALYDQMCNELEAAGTPVPPVPPPEPIVIDPAILAEWEQRTNRGQ